MGYTTDFIGYITIEPALNEAEIEYLNAFSASRRFDRPGGPYAVPGNPRAEEYEDIPADQYNANSIGQPSYWCQWVPDWNGCCLTFDGTEKFYQPVEWLRYLIKHFLVPGAFAAKVGGNMFADFTFDHVLNGTIAASRRDTRELYLINVKSNRVTTRGVQPPDPRWAVYGYLTYEEELDRERAARTRRRPTG